MRKHYRVTLLREKREELDRLISRGFTAADARIKLRRLYPTIEP